MTIIITTKSADELLEKLKHGVDNTCWEYQIHGNYFTFFDNKDITIMNYNRRAKLIPHIEEDLFVLKFVIKTKYENIELTNEMADFYAARFKEMLNQHFSYLCDSITIE